MSSPVAAVSSRASASALYCRSEAQPAKPSGPPRFHDDAQTERAYPRALREPDYADDCAVRRVRTNGAIKWAGDLIFVSEALIGEPVAIEETEMGEWRVRYADVELGFIDKRGRLRCRKLSRPPACGLVDNAQERCPQGSQAQQQQQPAT